MRLRAFRARAQTDICECVRRCRPAMCRVILETEPASIRDRVLLKGAVPESLSSYSEMTVASVRRLTALPSRACSQTAASHVCCVFAPWLRRWQLRGSKWRVRCSSRRSLAVFTIHFRLPTHCDSVGCTVHRRSHSCEPPPSRRAEKRLPFKQVESNVG